MYLNDYRGILYSGSMDNLPKGKLLINTINAYSFTIAQRNTFFRNALLESDVLLPDGISIVWASKLLFRKNLKKTAGEDLFYWEMKRLNKSGGKCFFLGSSEKTLQKIIDRARLDFPNVRIDSYSPPFKSKFSSADSANMIEAVNRSAPDVLFIGLTAPKQETWAAHYISRLHVEHVCCIGAVFDFYAGTIQRSPSWMIKMGLEWFYRLIREPKRMWKRYLVGNSRFVYSIVKEKVFFNSLHSEYLNATKIKEI